MTHTWTCACNIKRKGVFGTFACYFYSSTLMQSGRSRVGLRSIRNYLFTYQFQSCIFCLRIAFLLLQTLLLSLTRYEIPLFLWKALKSTALCNSLLVQLIKMCVCVQRTNKIRHINHKHSLTCKSAATFPFSFSWFYSFSMIAFCENCLQIEPNCWMHIQSVRQSERKSKWLKPFGWFFILLRLKTVAICQTTTSSA